MVKLAVRYDKNLKSNVFVVRDDESYVSSTKTVMTVSDEYFPTIDGHINYLVYRVDVTINVLREVGTSKVVLYDGDNVLDTFDWEGLSISTHYDFPVGTAHTLQAVFMGNTSCLKSKSKLFDVYLEGEAYDTQITYVGSYNIKRETSFSFELRDVHTAPILDGTLTVSYSDGTHNDIKEVTVSDGLATVDFGQGLDNITSGLFNITARYNGTPNYAPAVLEFQISKYYTVTLEGWSGTSSVRSSKYVLGDNYTLVGSFVDFLGHPYPETSVKFYGYGEGSWTLLSTGSVQTDGKIYFTLNPNEYQGGVFTKFRVGTADSYGFDEFNPVFDPEIVQVRQVDVTHNGIVNTSVVNKFSIEVYGLVEGSNTITRLTNVPVHVVDDDLDIDDVYVTNSQGIVTCQYPSLGFGGDELEIYSGVVYAEYDTNYYLTDYSAPSWNGQELLLYNATKQPLPNGMQYNFQPPSRDFSLVCVNIPSSMKQYTHKLTFTVVTDTDNNRVYYSVGSVSGALYVPPGYPDDNWLGIGDEVEYTYYPNTKEIVCVAKGRERFRVSTLQFGGNEVSFALLKVGLSGSVVLNNIKHEVIP